MEFSKMCSEFLGVCIDYAVPYMSQAYETSIPYAAKGYEAVGGIKGAVQIAAEGYSLSKGSKKFEYNLLVKEIEFIYQLHKEFKKYIKKLEDLQGKHRLTICNIQEFKMFSKSLDALMDSYKQSLTNNAMKLYWPDWYRQQLQHYLNFMNSFFENMKTLYTDLTTEIKRINSLPRQERSQALENLRNELRCLEVNQ
jgi:hypothetical protein